MNDDLSRHLLNILLTAPDGLSEYELINQLRSAAPELLPDVRLADPLGLFQTHFTLFNALYRLRDHLLATRQHVLQISALQIVLAPYAAAASALAEADPLRAYYLDIANLHGTSVAEVERLLASFWARLAAGDERDAALELFELDRCDTTLNLQKIRQRYRQLVSRHHPDRGGSTERLQGINAAMEILDRYYGHLLQSNSL